MFDNGFAEIRRAMPAGRISNAIKADAELRKVNAPKLGGMYYLEYPKEMIAQMFTSTSKVNKIKLLDQLAVTRGIKKNNKHVSFESEFPWVFAFDWRWDEVEEHRDGRCPFVGMDLNMRRTINHIGINLSGVGERFTPNSIFNILKRDRFWRRDITEEKLFDHLTKPDLLLRTELIYPTLLAIGVREDLAGIVASKLTSSLEGMDIKMNIQHISLNDGLLNTLDIRKERMLKSVIVPELEDALTDILLSIGYMTYIIGLYDGKMSKIRVCERENSMEMYRDGVMKHDEDALYNMAERIARFEWATDEQKILGMGCDGEIKKYETMTVSDSEAKMLGISSRQFIINNH
jgi:hypothetical protein